MTWEDVCLSVFPFVVRGCVPNTNLKYRGTRNMDWSEEVSQQSHGGQDTLFVSTHCKTSKDKDYEVLCHSLLGNPSLRFHIILLPDFKVNIFTTSTIPVKVEEKARGRTERRSGEHRKENSPSSQSLTTAFSDWQQELYHNPLHLLWTYKQK